MATNIALDLVIFSNQPIIVPGAQRYPPLTPSGGMLLIRGNAPSAKALFPSDTVCHVRVHAIGQRLHCTDARQALKGPKWSYRGAFSVIFPLKYRTVRLKPANVVSGCPVAIIGSP